MNVSVAYQGRSALTSGAAGEQLLRFAPNLNRDAVAFDAALRHPLRFREAISALHEVVINDLRFKPRDREAYELWKRDERQREATIRTTEYQRLKQEVLAKRPDISPDLEQQFFTKRKRYWSLRDSFSRQLSRRNPELWRQLMPCDPVVTVADDVVFFECFSADQSSYGCLTLDRESALGKSEGLQFGTTNVDYSWALFDHFQLLRSYRETRLKVDPAGFGALTTGAGEHREEKIDLPDGWLRGFMQVQSAMTLPMRRVTLSRDALYAILAWLRRHKARRSPRALRFELAAGQPPAVVLEPWEERIVSHGAAWNGPTLEPIRVWGVRRLLSLARLLPLVNSCEVALLGTGLPSFWIARMGEMRLTLGLSGWTVNDWSGGSALDLLAPPGTVPAGRLQSATNVLQRDRALPFAELQSALACSPGDCAATLNQLAFSGQAIHDLDAGVYRWRQVLPMPLGSVELGAESPELVAARELTRRRRVKIVSRTATAIGREALVGEVDGAPVDLVLDREGGVRSGKCQCNHHHRAGIRRGPCRHLLALRLVALSAPQSESDSTSDWYNRLLKQFQN